MAILLGGLACGVLDITAGIVVYGFFGVKPLRLLQGIASGLLGPGAFTGGIQTAITSHRDRGKALPAVLTRRLAGQDRCRDRRTNVTVTTLT